MAPTEMVQTGAPLTQARPSTPPSSPNASSEHVVTLSNAQQFIEMVNAIVAIQIASSPISKCTFSHALPENPTFQASAQPLTLENLEQLLLKLIDAKSEPPKVSEDAKPAAPPEATRASKLEYKTVTEVYASNGALINTANDSLRWDDEEEEYRIEESPERKVKTFDEYVFVMRTRIGK
jgi:hypothetical protein